MAFGERSCASIKGTESLRELADFAVLLSMVDFLLDRAIQGVVKKMVAKGAKMNARVGHAGRRDE
jgi:hypothetical protein